MTAAGLAPLLSPPRAMPGGGLATPLLASQSAARCLWPSCCCRASLQREVSTLNKCWTRPKCPGEQSPVRGDPPHLPVWEGKGAIRNISYYKNMIRTYMVA